MSIILSKQKVRWSLDPRFLSFCVSPSVPNPPSFLSLDFKNTSTQLSRSLTLETRDLEYERRPTFLRESLSAVFASSYSSLPLTLHNIPSFSGAFVREYVGEVIPTHTFLKRTQQYAREGTEHFYFMSLTSNEVGLLFSFRGPAVLLSHAAFGFHRSLMPRERAAYLDS